MTRLTWLAALALVPFPLVAGCLGRGAGLAMDVTWQPWGGDDLPHLIVVVENRGKAVEQIGPGGIDFRVDGPAGPLPVYWNGTEFSRPLFPGQTVVLALHPRGDGLGPGLAIDHDWGLAIAPTPGPYTVCLGSECIDARLKGV